MQELTRVAVDTSKSVFTLHGVDREGKVVIQRDLRRHQFEAFFAKLPPLEVAMEACGGAHHWARQLAAHGHQVRLIPPQYVKPFVKRGKTDRADAEAISEAAARPGMRFVPVKSAEQQASAVILSVRDLLVRQRTQLINALRGHAQEFGLVAAKKASGVAALLAAVRDDEALPAAARTMLDCRLLAEIPGIGPITALSLALRTDPTQFRSGRHFAAWIGLTPREHSSGGKQRLGGISRAGNETLRHLLVVGATAVIRVAKPGSRSASAWLLELLKRRPRKLAAVALANKMARIAWAMMTTGEAYRRTPATA